MSKNLLKLALNNKDDNDYGKEKKQNKVSLVVYIVVQQLYSCSVQWITQSVSQPSWHAVSLR